jgi:hypothetical protein
MTKTKVVKTEEGWALYLDEKTWVADFSSKTVALYFVKLIDTDNLLKYLVLGQRALEE